MESYVKAVLYVYPRLREIEKDYGEHIRNKAILSYDYRVTTEKLSEYLAEEILKKGLIEELRSTVEGMLDLLTEEERFLLELRYFGRKSKLKEYGEGVLSGIGSIRSYYRKRARVLKKAMFLLGRAGLTEEKFFEKYAKLDCLMSVYRYIEEGKEGTANVREKSLVGFLADRAVIRNEGIWLRAALQ